MPIPSMRCPNCGLVFESELLSGIGGIVTSTNNKESCPRCGTMCNVPNGVFDLRQQMWFAVRQPGMTREKVETFRDTVEAIKSGEVTADEAAADLAKVSAAFASILQAVGNNKHAQTMLVAILGMILTWYAIVCSNQGSVQAHADAQAQTEAIQRIDADLQSLSAQLQQATPSQPRGRWIQASPGQTPRVPTNRHERRKAKSKVRRS